MMEDLCPKFIVQCLDQNIEGPTSKSTVGITLSTLFLPEFRYLNIIYKDNLNGNNEILQKCDKDGGELEC